MTQASNDSTKKSTAPLSAHLLAGSKLRKQLSGTLQEHVSAPTSDFAVKQLEKMGWKEGTGLGKKRDGIVSHIKVKRREESAGLGTEKHAIETQQASEDWWKSSLGDTLAKLGGRKNKKKSKKRSRHFTDEELFEATGGARFGTKGGKTQKLAKWRRTESDTTNGSAGELTSTSQTSSSTKVSSSSLSESELETIKEKQEDAVAETSATNDKKPKKKSKKSKRKGGDEKKSKKKKKKARKEENLIYC